MSLLIYSQHGANERITGVTTTLPLLIGESEAMLKATVVVAQSRLPQPGLDEIIS